MKTIFTLLSVIVLATACNTGTPASEVPKSEQAITSLSAAKTFSAEATAVLAKALEAHGGDAYNQAHYQFVFRDKTYTFQNDGTTFRYQVTSTKGDTTVVDVLENGELIRTINGAVVSLSEKQRKSATEALNSVIYFATLPHKLTDDAVNIAFAGRVEMKGEPYEVLQVNFDQEGGGVDHDDQFRYWINAKSGRIGYLAYSYATNEGGVRFRAAYNPRIVEGILFQDHVNYKAPVGTPLDSLPALLEQGNLDQLSLIETENVTTL